MFNSGWKIIKNRRSVHINDLCTVPPEWVHYLLIAYNMQLPIAIFDTSQISYAFIINPNAQSKFYGVSDLKRLGIIKHVFRANNGELCVTLCVKNHLHRT